MNKILRVTIRERKHEGNTVFEGFAQLEGGTPFKLTKSKSTETRFASRATLTASANNFAKRFDLEVDFASSAAAKAKPAAKSNRSTIPAKNKAAGTAPVCDNSSSIIA